MHLLFIYVFTEKIKTKQDQTLPFEPTAMSWFLEERLKHVTQWGRAIFFIICRNKIE